MCDIWKANNLKREMSVEELEKHLDAFRQLGVQEVVLSGGEALMHSNLWKFCRLLRTTSARITLLSTGLLLKDEATGILDHCDEVIVSLDGSREVHNRIRNIPSAWERLAEGVAELKSRRSSFRVTARCVIQRANCFDFISMVESARDIGLDQISFLAADISSNAFNRPAPWDRERAAEVALSPGETEEFEKIVQRSFSELKSLYESRFIAETPDKMMRIVNYYRAINGQAEFSAPRCNAPWVSAVIDSEGNVSPCFFHLPYGNLADAALRDVLNSREAVAFRQGLNVDENPVCRRCVCSLHISPRVGRPFVP
jgi:MoaA/NifB/PqqE/SkfB family radical SAM enzyme